MKKLLYLLPVLFLASCKALGGGLWFVLLMLGGGAAYFGYKTIKSKEYNPLLNGEALFCYVLAIATVVAYFMMLNDK